MPSNNTKDTGVCRAYEDQEFLHSKEARFIRVMCEYEETLARLRRYNVKGTVLFFGSARSRFRSDFDTTLAAAVAASDADPTNTRLRNIVSNIQNTEWMCDYCLEIQSLAKKLTHWSVQESHTLALGHVPSRIDDTNNTKDIKDFGNKHLVVSTGGGNGFMEAANAGAASVPGTKNMGLLITLPCEPSMNECVSPELAFKYHYFFSRKFWLFYQCRALIVAPGGYGTLDELFEFLTLKTTGRYTRDIPVVLFGKSFWKTIVNWEAMVSYGVISQENMDFLYFTDDVDDAFTYVTSYLKKNAATSNDDDSPVADKNNINGDGKFFY